MVGCQSGEPEKLLTGQILNISDSKLATDRSFKEEAPEDLISEN